MIFNGRQLISRHPITDMETRKLAGPGGVTFGLGEAGYDIRIKQQVEFFPSTNGIVISGERKTGKFVIASSMEEFSMPDDMVAIVHDKSSWARKGLSVFNTVIEPGWRGYLTLELVYHGNDYLLIPAGSGIAQVLFHTVIESRPYTGRYQDQADMPVPSIEV